MLAICLSASLSKDARSVCKIPFVHIIHSQRQSPMPPLANEPARRDGPDLHNPRLVCKVLCVVDEGLPANTTRRGSQLMSGCRNASATTIKHLSLGALCSVVCRVYHAEFKSCMQE